MQQLLLPVDVHFVVEESGRTTLLVGGLPIPFDARKLPEVLSSPSLKQGRPRKARAAKERKVEEPPKSSARLKVVKGGRPAGTVHKKSVEWIANIAAANRKRAEERGKKGLCLRCDGKPVEGKKLCPSCIAKTARATSAGKRKAA